MRRVARFRISRDFEGFLSFCYLRGFDAIVLPVLRYPIFYVDYSSGSSRDLIRCLLITLPVIHILKYIFSVLICSGSILAIFI